MLNILEMCKIKLGIPKDENSKDELLNLYIDEIIVKAKNYCNREDIPEGMKYTISNIVIEYYNLNINSQINMNNGNFGIPKSITVDKTKVEMGNFNIYNSKSTVTILDDFFKNYYKDLNFYAIPRMGF